jgi:hypothetical protein
MDFRSNSAIPTIGGIRLMNRIETFMSELADLMERHRVDIDVLMTSAGYNGDMFDCVEFSSEPNWNDGSATPHEYEEFEMGGSFDHQSIREQLQED